jgi:hypothetical protein
VGKIEMNASMLNSIDSEQLRQLADVIITSKDIARGTTKFLENDNPFNCNFMREGKFVFLIRFN